VCCLIEVGRWVSFTIAGDMQILRSRLDLSAIVRAVMRYELLYCCLHRITFTLVYGKPRCSWMQQTGLRNKDFSLRVMERTFNDLIIKGNKGYRCAFFYFTNDALNKLPSVPFRM